MIYEVVGKLTTRGAAMTLRTGSTTKYAPVPAAEFLDQFQREQEELVSTLRSQLTTFATAPDLDYVWNIEGHENIIGKAVEMIEQARVEIYAALVPTTFDLLESALKNATRRGVKVVIYSNSQLTLPGGQVVVSPISEEAASRMEGLGLILVIDGEEVLISEWLTGIQARATWTSSPLLVFIAEHHLRTDPYLPEVLNCLGDQAAEIIREEDRELFARAMESQISSQNQRDHDLTGS